MSYLSGTSDADLRVACIQGDRRAQALLYRRYFGKLLGIPLRYTRDREEATAVLNQAFLRIFHSLDQYREEGSFAGWLSTITFRETMDHLRREKRHRQTTELEEWIQPATDNLALQHLAVEELYALIQRLPDFLRVVFSLYAIDGYKHHEIAKLLDITESTSKWRLAKARTILQTAVTRSGRINGLTA